MKLRPLNDRVLVLRVEKEEKTSGGNSAALHCQPVMRDVTTENNLAPLT
jgi:hypothetical protein